MTPFMVLALSFMLGTPLLFLLTSVRTYIGDVYSQESKKKETNSCESPLSKYQPNAPKENATELKAILARSRRAQQVLATFPQEKIDRIIKAITWSCCEESIAHNIANLAVDESKLGNYEGKFAKIYVKTRAALFDIISDKSVGIIESIPDRQIVKIAKPLGVIFAVVPCTNPEATPVIKAINAIKARNSIILSPSSRSMYVNELIVSRMRAALAEFGAPSDLIIGLTPPSREKTKFFLENCDFNWVTGSNGLVKAAYRSGVPSVGVGVGNAVVVVGLNPTETKSIDEASEKISKSKTFDLAASCSSDNSVVVLASTKRKLLDALKKQGGYVLKNHQERKKLERALFKSDGKLNSEVIVRSAEFISQVADIDVPKGTRFLIAPHEKYEVGSKFPLSGEKLCPVMAFYTVSNIKEAILLTNKIHEYQGKGHSCGIYSNDSEMVEKFALGTYTARVMVNQPQSLGNSGNLANGMTQTLSLGCGTWGGNSTTENINWRSLVNLTYVSRPLVTPKVLPNDEDLFGKDIITRVGGL